MLNNQSQIEKQQLGIWCPSGTITTVVGTGPTTGTYAHYLSYRSLDASSYVIPS